MITVTLVGLYVLSRLYRRRAPGTARVLPIVIESLALALIVVWRTLESNTRRF